MLTEIQILLTLGLAGAALVAAWPLFRLPRGRRILDGLSGTGLIAAGATLFGLVAGGFIEVPELTSRATAQEPQAEADDAPATATAASEPLATETPAAGTEPKIDLPTFVAPASRPAWINQPQNVSGDGIHTVPVASDPHAREADARRALDRALEAATSEYIFEQLGSQLAPRLLHYDANTIKRRFVKHENLYSDKATYLSGDMYESFALVEFDKSFRDELAGRWQSIRGQSRLAQVGLFAGAALLLLASVFGYFRLDNATRGYYTGRLQFLTAAAILAVIGAGVFAAQWIHWL
ncbi:MAG TPA: hypothetical protein VFB80_08270 [Pirellulaceae bacterium]|nr:hypothetical protein [Pirellulaceae bacterium]